MSPIKEKGSISTTLNLCLNLSDYSCLLLINAQQPITIMIGIRIVIFHIPITISNNSLITKAVIPRLKIKCSM